MEVGRDRVGQKPFLDGGHGDTPQKTAAAVADVEDHAALAAFEERRIDVTGRILLATQARVDVRVDVAWTELLRDQLAQGPFGLARSEVHHDRQVRQRARLDGALDGRPLWSGIVRRLDPDNQPRMTASHVGRRLHLHVGEILFVLRAAHAVADDVEEREDAGLRSIDDARLEVLEVPPAGAAGVGDGRHADAKGKAVRIDAAVPGVRPRLTRAGIDVRMDIDEPWRHVEPGDVNRLQRIRGIQLLGDRRNLAAGDRDIAHGADRVARIDDVATAQQQVVLRLHGRAR